MTLDDLQAAYVKVGAALGLKSTGDEILVQLCKPEHGPRSKWRETPLNSVLFAWMGVGGVHYVFLQLADRPLHECPVIEVAPEDGTQWCVGENLREFVELELQDHEDLVHEWPCDQPIDPVSKAKTLAVVAALRGELQLQPRPDRERYLRRLRSKYFDLLQLDPQVAEFVKERSAAGGGWPGQL